MTVQTDIDNLNSMLRSISRDAKSDARALIEGGAKYLQKLKSEKVKPIEFEPNPSPLESGRTFPNILVDRVEKPEQADAPALQNVDVLTYNPFEDKLPSWSSPPLKYNDLKTDYSFTEKLPKLAKLPKLRDPPSIPKYRAAKLTEPQWFDAENIFVELNDPDIRFLLPRMPELDYGAILQNQMEAFRKQGLYEYSIWLDVLVGKSLFDDLVLDYVERAMQGAETAVTDKGWEEEKYRQALHERMETYRTEVRALPARGRSDATGMPDGADAGRWTLIELAALKAAIQGIEKTEAERRTTEMNHQKWVLALAVKLVGIGLELRSKSLSDGIKAMKLGLSAAVGAEEISDMLFDFKRKQFALVKKYNDLMLAVIQQKVAIEQAKINKMKLDAEQNKIIVAHNKNIAQDFDIAVRWVELRIALYNAEMDYISVEQEDQQIHLENLELSYKAHEANTKSAQMAIRLLESSIRADKAVLSTELIKFTEYEAVIAKFKADITADLNIVKSQAASGKAKRATAAAKLTALIEYQQLLLSATSTTAQGLLAKYDAETETQYLKIDEQDFKNRKELEEERRTMQEDYTELRASLYRYSLLVSQRSAQCKTSIQGASTMGNIAEGAFGGMTAVGGGTKTEYA